MDFLRHGQPVKGLERALILVAVITAGQLTKETVPSPG
jgi:hypothetical protein